MWRIDTIGELILPTGWALKEALQVAGDWDGAGQMLAEAAAGLEAGGAELLILATNTMHKVPPLPAPAALPERSVSCRSYRLHSADAAA